MSFSAEVHKNFDFLISEYGFKCSASDRTFVRYESDKVFVNIFQGRSSHEIDLETGLVVFNNEPEEGFSMSWLIELDDPVVAKSYKPYAALTPISVRNGIFRLRNLFINYAKKSLSGDAAIFDALAKKRDSWKEQYARDTKVSQIKPKAHDAFRRKDYYEAVRMYESIESSLSDGERAKLEYARKEIGSGSN